MQNSIFNPPDPQPAVTRSNRWISYALIFGLTSASTAVMMLCPCDRVGVHDYHAISLVATAALLAIAAAGLIYRRLSRDSGMTAFLRALFALALAGVCVFIELFAAMEAIARMASAR